MILPEDVERLVQQENWSGTYSPPPAYANKISQCLAYAVNYQRDLLDEEIRAIELWPDITWPSFRKGWIAWQPTLSGRLFQLLMLPLVVPITLLLAALEPFTYFFGQRQRRKRLIKEREALAARPLPGNSQGVDFNALWRLNGLDKRFGLEHQLHVMERWIELLYGNNVLHDCDLKARAAEISGSHIKANSAYYQREKDAPHFCFAPVADCLARELAEKLPPYQG